MRDMILGARNAAGIWFVVLSILTGLSTAGAIDTPKVYNPTKQEHVRLPMEHWECDRPKWVDGYPKRASWSTCREKNFADPRDLPIVLDGYYD